jgi:hypothetical protein
VANSTQELELETPEIQQRKLNVLMWYFDGIITLKSLCIISYDNSKMKNKTKKDVVL